MRRLPLVAKLVLALFVVVAVPVTVVVAIYLLPPGTAVALGKPILAWLSDAPPLPDDLDPLTERSVLLAADGSELATLVDDINRVRITREQVPDVFVDALLAAEDSRFYEHPGLNHRAIMRAAVRNLRTGGIEQGGSTLTQQLVKNVYLEPSRTARRKLTEAWYALELEDRLGKDAILERYLNETYFGQGAYGLGAAAELYFGTAVEDLDAAQSATLVGIIPAPSRRNPIDSPAEAQAARDRVLGRMVATARLSAAEAETIAATDLALDITPPPPPAEPFFVAYVRDRLVHDELFDTAFGDDALRRERLIFGGGLTVHTTLDPRLQDLADDAIAQLMGPPATSPLATVVTVEPGTGAVRAMAVGPKAFGPCEPAVADCPSTMVNPAVAGLGGSGRQPGSAFKPFVLTAALAAGVPPGWQERTAEGTPIPGCQDDGGPYMPSNYSEDPGVKDMPEAIRVSNNVYHARLAGLLGPAAVVDTARAAGVREGILPEQCSVALGTGSAFPIDMAAAYATFANGGTYCGPMVVTRIEFGVGVDAEDADFSGTCEPVFDEEVAAQVVALLQEPVIGGTATAARLDRPVAGKTGTTDDYRDAWFVGFVPQLSTAAWIGYERPRPLEDVLGVPRVTGGSIPARLWAAYMQAAVADLDRLPFDLPPVPEQLAVPDYRGEDAAELLDAAVDDYRLHLELRPVRNYREAGTVVRQQPRAGTRVAAGQLVTLRVSDGLGRPPRVPDVIGLSEERATEILEDAGYLVVVEPIAGEGATDDDGVVEASIVVRTVPDAGSPLEPGEEVVLLVGTDAAAEDTQDPSATPSPSPDPSPRPRPSPSPGSDPRPDPQPSTEPEDPPARGQVKFGRIVADPHGSDTTFGGGEFVTLVTGRTGVDVSGWTITVVGGGTLRIGEGYGMPAAAELSVHTAAGTNRPPARYFNGLSRQVLRNSGGTLILRDRQGREISRRSY